MLRNPANAEDADIAQVAAELNVALGRITRRLRQAHVPGDLTLAEASVLARLDQGGPATPTELADGERVRPQVMSVTLASLEANGLVVRAADPKDGRRAVISATDEGLRKLRDRRDAKAAAVAEAMRSSLTDAEIDQVRATAALLYRLADTL